jgi:hypothetical protein
LERNRGKSGERKQERGGDPDRKAEGGGTKKRGLEKYVGTRSEQAAVHLTPRRRIQSEKRIGAVRATLAARDADFNGG